jgi:hypothetical protein
MRWMARGTGLAIFVTTAACSQGTAEKTAETKSAIDSVEMDLFAPTYYGNAGNDAAWWQGLMSNWPNWGQNSMIVVNESSGPGPALDSTLQTNISNFESTFVRTPDGQYPAQPKVLGYVNAVHGRSTTAIDQDIDSWKAFYGSLVSGIFFDQVARTSSDADDLAQIEYVTNHAKADGYSIVAFNMAGVYAPTQTYFHCLMGLGGYTARFILFEDYESRVTSSDYTTAYASGGTMSWVYNYDGSLFVGLVHDAAPGGSTVNADLTQLNSYHFGNVFVTDQPETPNPWAPGPSAAVWNAEGEITGEGITWGGAQGTSTDYSDSCPTPAP